jgi:hypothetical protein
MDPRFERQSSWHVQVGTEEVAMKKKVWAGLLALIISTTAAISQTTMSMDHNGSLMSYYTDDKTGYVTITYVQPKPSLWQWNVRPGTVLFTGRWIDRWELEGTAYVFGCGPIPYSVKGGIGPDNVLRLNGQAPIVAIWPFCGVVGWSWNSSNAHLTFYPTSGEMS